MTVLSGCDHGIVFDEAEARKILAKASGPRNAVDFIMGNSNAPTVKERWPRGWFTKEKPCPKGCGFEGIYYASEMHYFLGDW